MITHDYCTQRKHTYNWLLIITVHKENTHTTDYTYLLHTKKTHIQLITRNYCTQRKHTYNWLHVTTVQKENTHTTDYT